MRGPPSLSTQGPRRDGRGQKKEPIIIARAETIIKIGYVERECTTKNLTVAPHFLATEASSTIGNELLYTRSRSGMLAKEGKAAVSIMMIK